MIEIFKAEEVAEFLGVSRMTVYRLARSGKLRAVRVGRNYRFLRTSIEAYLEANTIEEPS